MEFSLSDEHRMVQDLVKGFAQKEVAPIIKDYDRKQEMADFILPRMGELGILGICLPVRYGGQGMDYIYLGLGCEELKGVDSPSNFKDYIDNFYSNLRVVFHERLN